MGYEFEWDESKAVLNERKHGVAFEEAATVFGDPLSLLMTDPSHSIEEERYLLLGLSRQHRLLVVAFAERGERTRLITARLATARERHAYEKGD